MDSAIQTLIPWTEMTPLKVIMNEWQQKLSTIIRLVTNQWHLKFVKTLSMNGMNSVPFVDLALLQVTVPGNNLRKSSWMQHTTMMMNLMKLFLMPLLMFWKTNVVMSIVGKRWLSLQSWGFAIQAHCKKKRFRQFSKCCMWQSWLLAWSCMHIV